ncbi:hypothetical protein [Flavobacterium sp.]|uniref:hypothetical protein n=1 Tax=Flavobacterium sp. TaxID=239 RepID=UPI004048290F
MKKISVFFALLFGFNLLLSQVAEKDNSISFFVCNNMMITELLIDGEKYNFLIDTGATTLVSQNVISKKTKHNKSYLDLNNSLKKIDQVEIRNIEIANLKINKKIVGLYDFSKISNTTCCKIDGILGIDILKLNDIKIDFNQNKILILKENHSFNENKTDKISFTEDRQGIPLLNICISDSIESTCTLDTGYSGFISAKFKENTNYDDFYISYIFNAFSVKIDTTYTKFKKIKIDSLESNSIINYRKDFKNLIGYNFIKNFEVSIDWKNKLLYLKQTNKTIESEIKNNNFGFNVNNIDNKIIVSKIFSNSISYNQLLMGDEILNITEFDLKNYEWNHCLINDFLNNPSITILSIVIMRDEKKLNIFLKQ